MARMNKNYGLFGAAVQTERGEAAAAPTASFHASADSAGMSAEKTLESIKLTKGSPVDVDSYVNEVSTKFDSTTLAFPNLLGLLLYAACGKDTPAAGSNGLHTHTIKCGNDLPYLTLFEQKGSAEADISKMQDAKVDSLTITAEGNKPLALAMAIAGCKMAWQNGTNTWPGDPFDISEGYFVLADAQVLFSLSTGEPVAVPAGIILDKIELTIANSVEGKAPLGSAAPIDQVEKGSVVSLAIEGSTDSTEIYREVATGSKTGENVASTVITGSAQIAFKHSNNPNLQFVMKIPTIPWKCDAMNVSVDGGDFDLKLSTDGALDTGSGAVEFLLTNTVESYLPEAEPSE